MAFLTAGIERRADAEQTAKLAVCTGLGAHRHAVHAGEVDQPERQLVDHFQRAGHSRDRLQWVHVGKARQTRHLLVEARVVLHRARPERKRSKIDRVVLTRETRVVADRFRLGKPRKVGRLLAQELRKPTHRCAIDVLNIDTALALGAEFEAQRFLEHETVITA